MPDLQLYANAVLRIDLEAIVANYGLIARQAGDVKVAAVVKADGYGLGAIEVAVALAGAGCRHFFVAQFSEAVVLKPALPIDAMLYILNGLQPGAEPACAAVGAIPVLNSLDQVERWAMLARSESSPLPSVLQFDTGMARLGLPPGEIECLVGQPDRLAGLDVQLVMSHLACGDDPDAPSNPAQAQAFALAASHFPAVPRSIDNSGGAFLSKDAHGDLVRAGIALYGGAPQSGRSNPMRPVVSLEAPIVQIREVPAGGQVGYGLSFVAGRASRIATIPVGYADGWPRHLSNRGSAFIGGLRAPIVGRVSMDSITLDVTDIDDNLLHPGAAVELLGPHQTIDEVAADAGTISYEILTQLGHRYARHYLPVQTAPRAGRARA
jgi:alanine racemase